MSTVRTNDHCEFYATGSDRVPFGSAASLPARFALEGFGPIGPQLVECLALVPVQDDYNRLNSYR
jgi:hypothetical protein